MDTGNEGPGDAPPQQQTRTQRFYTAVEELPPPSDAARSDAGLTSPLPTRNLSPPTTPASTVSSRLGRWDSLAGVYRDARNMLPKQQSIGAWAHRHASGFAAADAWRPFFNVDTKTVFKRLTFSLLVRKHSDLVDSPDLYSPIMLCFTLIAVCAMGQKAARHNFFKHAPARFYILQNTLFFSD